MLASPIGRHAWRDARAWLSTLGGRAAATPPPSPSPPVPAPETYATLVAELERWRLELAQRHRSSRHPDERAAVLRDARSLLELVLPEMMRCWLGTPWDFHGTARQPGPQPIACGYFVSTVLLDAGFRLDRYRLAQQPSSKILRTFLPADQCQLRTGADYDSFLREITDPGDGVVLVGLDTHVGFLEIREGRVRFLHSSGARPRRVVDESSEAAEVLRRSHWRMTGHLTASSAVLEGWLRGKNWPVASR